MAPISLGKNVALRVPLTISGTVPGERPYGVFRPGFMYSNPRWHNFKDDLRLAARPVKIVDLMATMCFFNLVLEYEMKEAKVTGHNIIIIYYLYKAN